MHTTQRKEPRHAECKKGNHNKYRAIVSEPVQYFRTQEGDQAEHTIFNVFRRGGKKSSEKSCKSSDRSQTYSRKGLEVLTRRLPELEVGLIGSLPFFLIHHDPVSPGTVPPRQPY